MADWRGGDKKPNWRGDKPVPGRKPSYGWKAGDAPPPGNNRRKAAAIAVGVLTFIVAATFVTVLLWPKPPVRPCLVLLAANPADHATSLDVPLDLYGWMSTDLLMQEADQRNALDTGKRAKFAPECKKASLPASDQELELWANTLKDCNPIVIYVGAHCGTGPEGPFLIATGHDRLPVQRLFDTLAKEPLKGKKKVLVLDPGRMSPNPVYGQITDDFARVMKTPAMNEAVKAVPDLLVIVGAGPGERAMESEERQATWLAYALADALNNREASVADDNITGTELFDHVRKVTVQKTKENGLACTPFLLPEGDAGRALGDSLNIAVAPPVSANSKDPVMLSAEAVEKLQSAWTKHDELRTKGDAAAYSPRLWRRYRELLLRYEAAIRAGEPGTVERLRAALRDSENALSERVLPTFDSFSGYNSAALRFALGDRAAAKIEDDWKGDSPQSPPPLDAPQRLAILNDVLRKLEPDSGSETPQQRLSAASVLMKLFPSAAIRPIEAHMPVMVQDFYAKYAPAGAVPPEWFTAIQFRSRLERAALGFDSKESPGPHYTEMLAERSREAIAKIDTERRTREDSLFATAAASADPKLADELKAIEDANRTLRARLTARDRAFADGTFLSEWLLASGDDPALVDELINEWRKFHQNDATPTFHDLLNRIEKKLGDAAVNPLGQRTQAQWLRLQKVLATPLIPADTRMALLKASREISKSLEIGSGKSTATSGNEQGENARSQAARRASLALAILKYDGPSNDVVKLATSAIGIDQANPLIGSQLADRYRTLAILPDPTGVVNADAEQASRVALPFEPDAQWEPATVNQRLRWRDLFANLGDRTAADRWCDESMAPGNDPYYVTVAKRYYEDAKKASASLPNSFTLDDKRKRSITYERLTLDGAPKSILWTSDQKRDVSFRLKVPSIFPSGGRGVLIRDFSNVAPLKSIDPQATNSRPLIALADNPEPELPSATLEIGLENPPPKRVSAEAKIYFRGAVAEAAVSIDIRRKAELVFLDPLPSQEQDLSFAVRGDKDLDLGDLVIILDLSGSMTEGLDGKPLPTGKDFRTEASKYKLALDALETVMLKLPINTRLRVRVFSDKDDAKQISRIVFGEKEQGIVTWTETQPGSLKPVTGMLRGLTPNGLTPLVDSILMSVREDFKNTKPTQTKTILVLTDGSDTSGGATTDSSKTDDHVTTQRKRLKGALENEKIAVNVVLFALGDEGGELQRAKNLFGDLPLLTIQGEVIESKDADRLTEILNAALRPRVKLMAGSTQPQVLPKRGWPVQDHSTVKAANALKWTPLVPRDNYSAVPLPWGLRDEQAVAWSSGARLFLEMAPYQNRMILRRGRVADLMTDAVKATHGDWTLLADHISAMTTSQPFALKGLAFLEKTPPHLRETNPDLGPQTLAVEKPPYVWWGLDAKAMGASLGTLTVTRQYGYELPAWEFHSVNWPEQTGAGRSFAPAALSAWLANDDVRSVPVSMPYIGERPDITAKDGTRVTIRTSFETHPITATAKGKYLVARVQDQAEKPDGAKQVYLELLTPNGKVVNAEHHYYLVANGYTAIFGPFIEDQLKLNPVQFKLIAATDLRATEPLRVETPPITKVNRSDDYRPKPDEPAKGN